MMHKPRIGLYAVYEPPEEGWGEMEAQLDQAQADLEAQGLEVRRAPEAVGSLAACERVAAWLSAEGLEALHALVVTWSFDHYTVEIQQRTALPVAVRSIPGIRSGSLVGGMQLNNLLHELGSEYRLFFGPLGDAGVAAETAHYLWACAIRRRLHGARLGVIGRRTEGMTPTAVDELEILRLFGVRLVNYGLDELLERAAQVDQDAARQAWQAVAAGAAQVLSTQESGVSSARNLLALQELAREQGLSAISIGSYPRCQGTMCLPIALLNQQGLPCGCEGDVNSTLAMLILSQLSDLPVHFGEMLEVDEAANTLVTSHCGCGSPALADGNGYILCPVRLAYSGVSVRFSARSGPVTYMNLVGRQGSYRMCAIEGQAAPSGMVFEGNPLKFVLQPPFRRTWRDVSEFGFGHHWMSAYARAVPVLKEFCQISGILGVFPDLDLVVNREAR